MSRALPSSAWQVQNFAHCLSLRDLACLACAQKDWQASIASIWNVARARQLVKALEAGSSHLKFLLVQKQLSSTDLTVSTPAQLLSQLFVVLSYLQECCFAPWGPAIAAAPGLLEDLTQLFTAPQMPHDVVRELVQHMGVRISYQQLLHAAHGQVAGVDIWVQVQEELAMHTDIPGVAVAICCGQIEQLVSLTLLPANTRSATYSCCRCQAFI